MFKSFHIVVWSHYYVYSVYHDKISNRRRKVLDTSEGGGGGGGVGGARFRILGGRGPNVSLVIN